MSLDNFIKEESLPILPEPIVPIDLQLRLIKKDKIFTLIEYLRPDKCITLKCNPTNGLALSYNRFDWWIDVIEKSYRGIDKLFIPLSSETANGAASFKLLFNSRIHLRGVKMEEIFFDTWLHIDDEIKDYYEYSTSRIFIEDLDSLQLRSWFESWYFNKHYRLMSDYLHPTLFGLIDTDPEE